PYVCPDLGQRLWFDRLYCDAILRLAGHHDAGTEQYTKQDQPGVCDSHAHIAYEGKERARPPTTRGLLPSVETHGNRRAAVADASATTDLTTCCERWLTRRESDRLLARLDLRLCGVPPLVLLGDQAVADVVLEDVSHVGDPLSAGALPRR